MPTEPASSLRILTHSLQLAPVGGVEVCTLQDALALTERGHHIDLAFGADGVLRTPYEEAGVTLAGPFSFALRERHALRDAGALVAPARWARRRRPDVVWLNRIEHLVWGQAASRASGASLVCHLHGPPVSAYLRLLGRGVAHFVAVSDHIRQAYVDRGIDPDRITTVHNALPPGRYPFGGGAERAAARRELGLPAEAPVVLCYGQMSADKGLRTLLPAWRRVWADRPDALLVLVDSISGDPDPEVERERALLDPRSVRVFPITSDVVPFLHAADVVAFPTLLPEAFGRVVLETMATGRPVVASRVGAVPELLPGGLDRFLVEPGVVEELAAGLAATLDWRAAEPELGAECAAWVAARFPFAAHIDQLESILSAAGATRKRGRVARSRHQGSAGPAPSPPG